MADYRETVDYILGIPLFAQKIGKENLSSLLCRLGNPEKEIPAVHVAGTNGKGSTCRALAQMLTGMGYRVGLFTSPHLVSINERIQIDGENISDADFVWAFETVKEKFTQHPSFFEVMFAMAAVYFREKKCDFVGYETGMGGRLDATNVIKHPELTVISSISYDHKAILGDTLEEIACQKAGIIKESAPVVLSENPEEVCKVVKHEAAEKKVHCIEVKPQDYEILAETPYGSTFLWKEQRYETKLPGNHQISNAVTALTASEYLFEKDYEKNEARKKIPKELDTMNIKAAQQGGIIRTIWPGRLEVLKKEPLFYRDGAHNPDGARKLASFLQKHFTNKRIIYIMGVLKDKEYTKILQYLMPMAKKVYVFRPNNERGLSAEILANTIKEKADVPVMIEPDVNTAVSKALEAAQPEDILVACGSLSFLEEMEAIQ